MLLRHKVVSMNQGEGSPAWYVEICLEKVADNLEIKFLDDSGFQNRSLSNVRCSKVTHSRWAMPLKIVLSVKFSPIWQCSAFLLLCLSLWSLSDQFCRKIITGSKDYCTCSNVQSFFHIFLSLDQYLINAWSFPDQCLIIARSMHDQCFFNA